MKFGSFIQKHTHTQLNCKNYKYLLTFVSILQIELIKEGNYKINTNLKDLFIILKYNNLFCTHISQT